MFLEVGRGSYATIISSETQSHANEVPMIAQSKDILREDRLLLQRFSIGAFRGIRDLDMQGLGRFNLLVGGGNSGKTSILEAIAIFSAPLNLQTWLNVVRSRDVRVPFAFYSQNSNMESLSWLFPHSIVERDSAGEHSPISLRAGGDTPLRELRASIAPIQGLTTQVALMDDENGEEREVEEEIDDTGINFEIISSYDNGELPLDGEFSKIRVQIPYWQYAGLHGRYSSKKSITIPCEYMAPYSHRNQPAQLRGLRQAVIDNEKASVNRLIQDLDPCVRGVEIITDNEGSRPLIALRHCVSGLAPLSVFGDGLRRALTIALAIQQAKNGLLLIDEIEAALHISALDKVFPWIMRACREYNVQLFATTHSLEAVDAISQASDDSGPSSIVAYHLSGGNGDIKRYSNNMLCRLVHERGLDIR